MKFKPRIIRKKDGSVEVKVTLRFDPDEAKAISRIPDDPNVGFHQLRSGGPDQESFMDHYLCYLRIICYWCWVWARRDEPTWKQLIIDSASRRRGIEKFKSRRRRKR